MKLAPVTIDDCGRVEGSNLSPLHDAVIALCPGLPGEALWEKIRDTFGLGVTDCATWVERMNQAIGMWNLVEPQSCTQVKVLYGIR